jgi:signal peptidase I
MTAESSLGSEDFCELARQILAQGNSLRFRAVGMSMRPMIQNGDLLEVIPVRKEDIRLGDVLLYEHAAGLLFAHRVVRIVDNQGEQAFLLQGDAVRAVDGNILPHQILGRVIGIERGKHVRRLNSLPQHILAVGLALLLPVYKRNIPPKG